MNVVDILILVMLLLYIAKGFSNGVIKEGVSFLGGLAVIVISFALKNPISVFMYQNLPFFKFSGILSGISVLNIIIYEIIAFLVVATVLLTVYRLVIKVTNVLETILKFTFILALPSKLLGAVVGLIEGVIFVFLVLFICMQFDMTRPYIETSKYGDKILSDTPILGHAISPIYDSLKEIYSVAENYRDSNDKAEANLKSFDVLLKYKVISPDNADVLVKSGKLNMPGAEELVQKYWEEKK